jgi:hypothetical protein
MKFSVHEHCGGLSKTHQSLRGEVEKAIDDCSIRPALRSATPIRDAVTASLVRCGWSGEVPVAVGSQITITSTRMNTGLCLQTGNMSRLYADLMKLQKLFLDDSIKAGIVVVPALSAAREMGDNIANSSRLIKELEIFRKVVHMPLVIYAFE